MKTGWFKMRIRQSLKDAFIERVGSSGMSKKVTKWIEMFLKGELK